MKRLLAAVAVTPLLLVALGGPAAAAKPDTKPAHVSEGAVYAHAGWEYDTADAHVEGGLSAVHTRKGPVLVLDQSAWGEGGAWTHIEIVDQEHVDFDFSIDRGRLSQATLQAEDVPVAVCTWVDWDDEEPDCVNSTVDMALTWTGEGPISRNVSSGHSSDGELRINTHVSEVQRAAQVSGALTGAVDVDDFSEGLMVKFKFVEITRCRTDCDQSEE